MWVSAFDVFQIGLGPSSSRTIGPMRAARRFVHELAADGLLEQTARVVVDLYGGLALTGRSQNADRSVVLGLTGETPEGVDPDRIEAKLRDIHERQTLVLDGDHPVYFRAQEDLRWRFDKALAFHSNAIRFSAFDFSGHRIARKVYFSVGAGFVVDEQQAESLSNPPPPPPVPFPFNSAADLLNQGITARKRIPDMMRANELALRSPEQVRAGLLERWAVMNESIERGLARGGTLPGGLSVPRRARDLRTALLAKRATHGKSPADAMDWVSVFAIAVGEENAAGGRIVTAPTNGAAGVVPAVIRYYRDYCEDADDDGVVAILLTASAIGALFKYAGSVMGAEVGCQGEVGVACSMAAAGLTAALGGNNVQITNAAQIGMEHHLGMSCDPEAGLVQNPCIERTAVAAAKAIDAASQALNVHNTQRPALDAVIKGMYDSGRALMTKYKESSLGGLAVNAVDC